MQAMSGCAGFLSLSLPSDLLNKDPLRPIMPAWVNRPFNRTVASGPFGPDCAVKQPKKMPACNQATVNCRLGGQLPIRVGDEHANGHATHPTASQLQAAKAFWPIGSASRRERGRQSVEHQVGPVT